MQKPLALGAITLSLVVLAAGSTGAISGLTEAARLSAIYDVILAGDVAGARAQIASACPPAPAEACQALTAVATWWEIQIDPNSRALDRLLEDQSAAAIAAAERWTVREPQRAEAWFYLAGAHAPLTQWRVLRGERLSAARAGKRIKDALERAMALDPSLTDAYFGIGAYHYYADIAPAALKMLRWLLLLPGGDRAAGLREMETTRDRGVLLRGEADFQLHYIYVWYERQPQRALELLRGLDARYPGNPLFLQRIAEVQRDYLKDHAASRDSWQRLLDRARNRRVAFAPIADTRARLGLAHALTELAQPAAALDLVAPVIDANRPQPYGAIAEAHLARGRAYLALNDPDRARVAFDRALATTPSDDPDDVRARVRAARAQRRSR